MNTTYYIKNFQFDNMEKINDYLRRYSDKYFNFNELQNLLMAENVSFVLSGINRLQSTLICEAGFSYVQQSQRYVPVNNKFIKFLDNTPEELIIEGSTLVNKSINLYNKMTELVNPNKKGRPAKEDFVHGIMYEDGRSVLPLAMSTHLVVSMSADKLIDLFILFTKYPLIFKSLQEDMEKLIPFKLYHNLTVAAYYNTQTDNRINDNYFKENIKDLSLINPIYMLNSMNNVAVAALASQNEASPDEVYNSWGPDTEANDLKICRNVLGYGHHGINEHSRTKFAMTCSLAAYHQVIRHRLQNIRREALKDLVCGKDREYVIPKSIIYNDQFLTEFHALIDEYEDFYAKYNKKYDIQFLMQFMLNAAAIRFVVSSNIRNDNNIFKDRLCYTAQEEIRELYLKKFKILHNTYPHLVKKYAIPPCVTTGKCKEGKLTCGHMAEVKEQYKDYI